nr:hypothetical protein [Tanacetum cinerariifolium]
MDPNSSLGKICLGDDVVIISSDKVEGSGDWNSPEYQDTAGSKGKKVMNALSFYKMETDEISERYIAPCFVNGLEAYDGEINLAFDENLISNEFAIKLCLDYEIKKGKKVILGRSFLRLAKGVIDFGDWDQLLDFNFDDGPKFREELPPFVCKMGKRNHNKKRAMENLNLFYQDIGPSSSAGGHLTQEKAYKKILDEIRKDKVELDGKTVKEDKEALKRIKGEALKEKDDLYAFIFLIRLEGKVNENVLFRYGAGFGPYIGAPNLFLLITYSSSSSLSLSAILRTSNLVVRKEHMTEKPDHHDPNAHDNTKQWKNFYFHKFTTSFYYGKDVDVLNQMGCDREIDDMLRIMLREAGSDEEIFTFVAWIRAFNINEPIYAELCHEFNSTYEFDEVCTDDELQSKKIIKFRLGGRAHNLTFLKFDQRDLDRITLRDLIDSDGKLVPKYSEPGVPIVGIPRPPRVSMHDLYDRMGRMEIRQDVIEQMEYSQSYHRDMYHGVFEHMAGVYSIPLQGTYNPLGYAQPQYDQYYQQYQPLPPQYQQQQDDDE